MAGSSCSSFCRDNADPFALGIWVAFLFVSFFSLQTKRRLPRDCADLHSSCFCLFSWCFLKTTQHSSNRETINSSISFAIFPLWNEKQASIWGKPLLFHSFEPIHFDSKRVFCQQKSFDFFALLPSFLLCGVQAACSTEGAGESGREQNLLWQIGKKKSDQFLDHIFIGFGKNVNKTFRILSFS